MGNTNILEVKNSQEKTFLVFFIMQSSFLLDKYLNI